MRRRPRGPLHRAFGPRRALAGTRNLFSTRLPCTPLCHALLAQPPPVPRPPLSRPPPPHPRAPRAPPPPHCFSRPPPPAPCNAPPPARRAAARPRRPVRNSGRCLALAICPCASGPPHPCLAYPIQTFGMQTLASLGLRGFVSRTLGSPATPQVTRRMRPPPATARGWLGGVVKAWAACTVTHRCGCRSCYWWAVPGAAGRSRGARASERGA